MFNCESATLRQPTRCTRPAVACTGHPITVRIIFVSLELGRIQTGSDLY